MKVAYYNEIDPYAAQWLRNLIAAGHIAPGDVDERSIEDVKPDDLRNYTQCHFFAGIGVWSYALRNAGWPDDKPVWTGSCPCQPFSAAGKGSGFDDERHLWPHFHWLISECRPQHVFGEQVASGNANAWFDLVQADVEAMGYAFGLVPFPSAGVGAPHIRDRAYWVANANGERWNRSGNRGASGWNEYSISSDVGGVAVTDGLRRERGERPAQRGEHHRKDAGRLQSQHGIECGGKISADRLANSSGDRQQFGCSGAEAEKGWEQGSNGGGELPERSERCSVLDFQCATLCRADGVADANDNRQQSSTRRSRGGECATEGNNDRRCGEACGLANTTGERGSLGVSEQEQREERQSGKPNHCGGELYWGAGAPAEPSASPVNGFWRDADWLFCRDEKWRPVRPGSFPLVDGATARVGRLRAYGNAINAEAAKVFIATYMDAESK
ncbi:DNA cytosine methyltransferase [Serratia marcescens]|uniref:DNA cytosine methyltransferase n=2 Tax=Serratia marcescens TaxID=615 RepID=UPI0015616E6D|nr:DNA cytosine methyltransferase [Serratia marcescens]NRN24995.1 DNA cytosine methyltransferase [Serratia marcescens]NRN54556.1 DNA cytosine methyltransferase [Serratia marcescens]